MKSIKIIIDGGVQTLDRLVLDSAAVQFASAYKGMKTSVYFAGKASLRGRYDLLETNKISNIISHMDDVVRRKIKNPSMFNEPSDTANLLLELVSERSRSNKKILIALFTTEERISELQKAVRTNHERPRAIGEFDMTDVITFLMSNEHVAPRAGPVGGFRLGSIVNAQKSDILPKVIEKV